MKDIQIKIFDTTLRDGQQCPGAGMSIKDNLAYAKLAIKTGVDILEAGFPAASKQDAFIVQQIAQEVAIQSNGPTVAALCQLREEQFDITMNTLLPALSGKKARLHTYLPIDPELMHVSLGKLANQKLNLVKQVFDLISKASAQHFEVQLSLEGYSRMGMNFDFVTDAFRAVVSVGATIINCPDTIGGACKLKGPIILWRICNNMPLLLLRNIVINPLPGQYIVITILD